MIKGETVQIVTKTVTDTDPFGKDIVVETMTPVQNVIVGNPSTEAVATELNLTGKVLIFVLGIPKGDTHDWKDADVIIRGERFKTFGYPLTQTAHNVPGRWNTQVKVGIYE